MKNFKYSLIGYLAAFVYWILCSTWRYRVQWLDGMSPVDIRTRNPKTSLLFAHWHGDELALLGLCRHSKFLTFSSKSKDGTIMAAALRVFGFRVIRGSSTRGGVSALISLIKVLRREKYYVSFAIDGPNGPRHQAKDGIYFVSKKLRLPIIQGLVRCDSRWDIPNTWNKAYLPRPFARIDVYLYPVPWATDDNQEEITRLLNSRT